MFSHKVLYWWELCPIFKIFFKRVRVKRFNGISENKKEKCETNNLSGIYMLKFNTYNAIYSVDVGGRFNTLVLLTLGSFCILSMCVCVCVCLCFSSIRKIAHLQIELTKRWENKKLITTKLTANKTTCKKLQTPER